MEPKPPTSLEPEREPKILSFEEFTRRKPNPRYNNFFLYFLTGEMVESAYHKDPHYIRFASEHPDLNKSLCEKIQNLDESGGYTESLKPFEGDLYVAYKIMRDYGASNHDLFS